MPANLWFTPFVIQHNMCTNASLLMALMPTSTTGTQPVVITTAFSDKPKNDISTNLLFKPANMPCTAVPKKRGTLSACWKRAPPLITVPPRDLHFRDPATGNVATTPAANLEILHAHCHKVYNRDDTPVDFSVLDDIPQRATLNALGTCPSVAEIQEHITKLTNNKSPGESGVPAEALKALPPDGIQYVHTLLQDYWDGHSDYDEWQTALL
jgi:hypothetical protein